MAGTVVGWCLDWMAQAVCYNHCDTPLSLFSNILLIGKGVGFRRGRSIWCQLRRVAVTLGERHGAWVRSLAVLPARDPVAQKLDLRMLGIFEAVQKQPCMKHETPGVQEARPVH